jgi:hypothetical protein
LPEAGPVLTRSETCLSRSDSTSQHLEYLREVYICKINAALEQGREDLAAELADDYLDEVRAWNPPMRGMLLEPLREPSRIGWTVLGSVGARFGSRSACGLAMIPPAGDSAPAGRASAIRTFLIADIRGYTRFTQERGDEAAARLAARFAEIVQEGVEASAGELVELRGDEALVVFASARHAIRSGGRSRCPVPST